MTRSPVCGVLVPQFIKHKDDAGTSIVTGENDAQDRTRGGEENTKTSGVRYLLKVTTSYIIITACTVIRPTSTGQKRLLTHIEYRHLLDKKGSYKEFMIP